MSEFLHKDMFDEHHKLIAFDPKELLKKNPRISRPSSGTYEGGLLCEKCDNAIIGKYETYASKLYNEKLNNADKIRCHYSKSIDNIKVLELSNINYSSFKLFLLSLLWRANISSRDEYRDVNLGPYGEKIRYAILNEDSGNDLDTIITITKLDPAANFSTFIGQPRRHKIGQSTSYSIIINGYIIVYHLKENDISEKAKHHRLKEDGTLTILEVPKNRVEPFVMKYIGAVE
ncbi:MULTISPECIES: hypothetical protein [Flavobacteriaceae]|uniref:hypothetical protein n=1 Tax=Flavobacteriaceae TaxID=49546 RepID=UPI00234B1ED3|nr:hypothetical protein [Muricauda sp. SP22]MDC6363274.1 hypothetical protein [Muricauda sp. SP22]